ncbi:MAG: TolC family protein [bacterium]|nr:TolC family protein [bacterium]
MIVRLPKWCIQFALLAFGFHVANAQPVSLDDCFLAASQHNANRKLSSEKLVEVSAKIAEAKGQRGPTVALTGSAVHNGDVTKMNFGATSIQFQPDNSYRVGFTANQTLFDGKRLKYNQTMQELMLNRIRSERVRTELDLAYQVSSIYNRWISVTIIERIAKLSATSAQEHAALTEKRFLAGQVSKLDKLRASVSANQMEVNALNAVANQRRVIETINLLTGLTLSESNFPSDTATSSHAKPTLESGLQAAKELRPEYRQLAANRAIAATGVTIAKSGLYPMVSASTNLLWVNGSDPYNPDKLKRQWNVGIQCNYNLFDGKQSKARIEAAKSSYRQVDIFINDFAYTIRNEIEQALISLDDAERRVAMQRVYVEQAEEAHRMATVQFAAGQTSAQEVSDAELALSTARLNCEQARFDYRNALLEYEKATGELSLRFTAEALK